MAWYPCVIDSETLYNALLSLPEKQRTVILLDFWQDLTDIEIATQMEVAARYIPSWYLQLDELALPESWRFKNPDHILKNENNPILERYIQSIFRKQALDYDAEPDSKKKQEIFHFENEFACFHTGLYTRSYKGIMPARLLARPTAPWLLSLVV